MPTDLDEPVRPRWISRLPSKQLRKQWRGLSLYQFTRELVPIPKEDGPKMYPAASSFMECDFWVHVDKRILAASNAQAGGDRCVIAVWNLVCVTQHARKRIAERFSLGAELSDDQIEKLIEESDNISTKSASKHVAVGNVPPGRRFKFNKKHRIVFIVQDRPPPFGDEVVLTALWSRQNT